MNLKFLRIRKYLKIFYIFSFFLLLFFWDVALRTSGKGDVSKYHREAQLIPLSQRLFNELSDREEFIPLEIRVNRLLDKYAIKGASVAVMKDGRLVLARGFGYADQETNQFVEPKHVFRVASVSKLITAVAVMKLVEEGELSLDDKIFGEQGLLNDSVYMAYKDKRVEDITIRNLLNHSAGWNRNYGDHMFMQHEIARQMKVELPVVLPVIIEFALNKRLHFRPGSRTSYSNLGYAILGMVIEKKTGQTYVDYVTKEIFKPAGIYDIYMGRNLMEEKLSNEVIYYEQRNVGKVHSVYSKNKMVERTYGGNDIELLGAAGGWIATAPDLMKFLSLIDGDETIPDILSIETLRMMTNPLLSGGHTIGWSGTDGRGNWWRTGTFAGTSAVMMRQANGFNWIILTNTSTWRGSKLSREINREIQASLNEVETWPEYDLFQYIEPKLLQRELANK
jgi:CubicO group peptidase (beta-lactamase class C family)